MSKPQVRIFESTDRLVEAFTEYFIKLINEKEGAFNVALSGGSTPKVWFENMVKSHKAGIPWQRIHFYWGDERCVAPDDEQSNYGMTKKYLFDHLSVPAENIHRIQGELKPEIAAESYAELLAENLPLDKFPVFDLVILGMGDDGHTASIFPHEIDLWNSSRFSVVAKHPDSGQKRVSFTGGVINNAHAVAFLVTGKNKAEKVDEIIHKKPISASYPASLVLPNSGKLTWFLDGSAGQLL